MQNGVFGADVVETNSAISGAHGADPKAYLGHLI